MNTSSKLALALGLALSAQSILHAQDHAHLNVGALGTNQNEQLYFANGAAFIDSSGYVKTLNYTNAGTYAGYFQQNITLIALPRTSANAGPDPAAAAFGSFIQAGITCLEAPLGGAFAFWDTGATAPTISLTVGQTSTNLWVLSENNGSPGSDPYGHIHGRRFTATKPGLYKVAFRAVDTSTNGLGGGPIHTPSATLPVYFEAGVNVVSVEPDFEEGHVHVRFAAPAGFSWQLEVTSILGPQAQWMPVGNPVVANDTFAQLIDNRPPNEPRFYRVNGTALPPP
jgi:hypothetical protein